MNTALWTLSYHLLAGGGRWIIWCGRCHKSFPPRASHGGAMAQLNAHLRSHVRREQKPA